MEVAWLPGVSLVAQDLLGNLHNCPPLAAMPDHGSTGPPRCHIAFAPSDPALLTATSPLQRQLLPACRLSPPSTMADSIRGDGVLRAHRALDALLDDPERLQRDRERFSRSPPAYRSQPSGSTTRSPSPTASAMIKSGETR